MKLSRGIKEFLTAATGLAALILALALIFALSGCTAWRENPTEIRAWAAVEIGSKVMGTNPTGNILITQPLPMYLEVSYLHISSIPDYYDLNTVDQVGIGFCVKVPLERC